MSKTFLFQAIQLSWMVLFSISMQFISIWPIDWTLSGVTTLSQSGPGSNGNEEILCIPQSSSITGTSPSDCLVSYPGHSLGRGLTPLQKSSQCILQPQPTGQINYLYLNVIFYFYLSLFFFKNKKRKKMTLITWYSSKTLSALKPMNLKAMWI